MTHIIMIEEGIDYGKLGIKPSDNLVIIADKNGMIPISALPYISENKKDIRIVENFDETEIAFLCGRLCSTEGTVQIHTANKHLSDIVNGQKKERAKKVTKDPAVAEPTKRTRKKSDPAPVPEKKTFENAMNSPEAPEKTEKPAEAEKKENSVQKRTKKREPVSDVPKMTEKEVKEILKKGGYDEDYACAVLSGMEKSVSRTTVDMMIRMELAKITKDETIIHEIPELIVKNLK